LNLWQIVGVDGKRASINAAITKLKQTRSLTLEEHDAILDFKDRLHLVRWPQYEQSLLNYGATPPFRVLANEVPAGPAIAPPVAEQLSGGAMMRPQSA